MKLILPPSQSALSTQAFLGALSHPLPLEVTLTKMSSVFTTVLSLTQRSLNLALILSGLVLSSTSLRAIAQETQTDTGVGNDVSEVTPGVEPVEEPIPNAPPVSSIGDSTVLWKPAAEKGDPQIQYLLGMLYTFGVGITQDQNQALQWLQKAADSHFTKAQYLLGQLYQGHMGFAKDMSKAARYYERAALGGHPGAQRELGGLYERGEHYGQDGIMAELWYLKAAEKKDVLAQYTLGRLYLEGTLIPKSEENAQMFFRKAANRGFAPAQYQLAWMYVKSQGGLKKNLVVASRLLQQAAKQGNIKAQQDLAWILSVAKYSQRTAQMATRWLERSAEILLSAPDNRDEDAGGNSHSNHQPNSVSGASF